MATTLIALDVDHVVNVWRPDARERARVGEVEVSWDASIIPRLRALAERPDVTMAWLSDWCAVPEYLRELERTLGLGPWLSPVECFSLPGLSKAVWEPTWWKRAGLVELLRDSGATRAVWVDDNLPDGLPATFERWEFGVHPDRGLDHENLDQLIEWVDRVK